MLARHTGGISGDVEQIESFKVGGTHAGEVEELAQQPVEALTLTHYQARQRLLVFVIRIHGARELLHRAANGRQWIADFVCQRSTQRCDRLEAFGTQPEFLEFLQVGDIGEDCRHQ